jgi:hypothetical protein
MTMPSASGLSAPELLPLAHAVDAGGLGVLEEDHEVVEDGVAPDLGDAVQQGVEALVGADAIDLVGESLEGIEELGLGLGLRVARRAVCVANSQRDPPPRLNADQPSSSRSDAWIERLDRGTRVPSSPKSGKAKKGRAGLCRAQHSSDGPDQQPFSSSFWPFHILERCRSPSPDGIEFHHDHRHPKSSPHRPLGPI